MFLSVNISFGATCLFKVLYGCSSGGGEVGNGGGGPEDVEIAESGLRAPSLSFYINTYTYCIAMYIHKYKYFC